SYLAILKDPRVLQPLPSQRSAWPDAAQFARPSLDPRLRLLPRKPLVQPALPVQAQPDSYPTPHPRVRESALIALCAISSCNQPTAIFTSHHRKTLTHFRSWPPKLTQYYPLPFG